jgi:signal transduction histidine kinase
VFVNIILNAVDAMQKGGRLTITIYKEEAFLFVEFKDTGTGIFEANKDKLFEPFFTTKTKGTGLGLAISNTIVERHGGKIEVESVEGEGAVFTVKLPT